MTTECYRCSADSTKVIKSLRTYPVCDSCADVIIRGFKVSAHKSPAVMTVEEYKLYKIKERL